MTRTLTPSRLGVLACAGALFLSCGASRAQVANPLLGTWSGPMADGSGVGTDVYGADGTLVSTAQISDGMGSMLVRMFARYRVQQVGPNQVEVEIQMVGFLPRRVCSVGSNGTDCRPFPTPDLPTSMTVTFLDRDTIQAAGAVSHRDPSPGLSQAQVPETAMVQAQNTMPGPSVSDTCTLGSTVCLPAGWRAFCERWPDGHTGYMQHGVRCREGYNQPEF